MGDVAFSENSNQSTHCFYAAQVLLRIVYRYSDCQGFFVRGGKGPNNRYRKERLVGNQGPALPLCLQALVCLCRIFTQK